MLYNINIDYRPEAYNPDFLKWIMGGGRKLGVTNGQTLKGDGRDISARVRVCEYVC